MSHVATIKNGTMLFAVLAMEHIKHCFRSKVVKQYRIQSKWMAYSMELKFSFFSFLRIGIFRFHPVLYVIWIQINDKYSTDKLLSVRLVLIMKSSTVPATKIHNRDENS